MYTLTDVTKTFPGKPPVEALRGLSLTIADGELLAVQGPTGGGKSTLLQMLGALDRPTSGSVLLDDEELAIAHDSRLTALRAGTVGIVFQGFNLVPTLTALENVQTALVPLGFTGDERVRAATEALAQVGLADRADHLPTQLSGGQQQRVAIARALVKQPRVLLADEPTGNLDEQMRDEIVDLLLRVWREQQLTVVVVTHDSAVAARAQRVVEISAGRLVERVGAAG